MRYCKSGGCEASLNAVSIDHHIYDVLLNAIMNTFFQYNLGHVLLADTEIDSEVIMQFIERLQTNTYHNAITM